MINHQILKITFNSPNKKAINKACLLFARYLLNQNTSILKKIKISTKKTKKKSLITLLKSPHVHKTAQETFASEFYKKKITFTCYRLNFCNLHFLKKNIELLFSNVNIKTQIYNFYQQELQLLICYISLQNKKKNKNKTIFYKWTKKIKKKVKFKKKHFTFFYNLFYQKLKKQHPFILKTNKNKYVIKTIVKLLQLLCLTGEFNPQIIIKKI